MDAVPPTAAEPARAPRALPAGAGEYIPELDALRAFAVLAVLASHFGREVPLLHDYGPLGVRLFFVLSGFLITGILIDARRRAAEVAAPARAVAARFYARRGLRLLPLLYVVLAIAVAVDLGEIRRTWPWHAFYASNLLFAWTGAWDGPFSHFWSLAVEEQFYLLWPAVVLALPPARLERWLGGMFVAAIAWRLGSLAAGVSDLAFWTLPFASLDALAAGAALATHARSLPAGGPAAPPSWLRLGLPPALALVAVASLLPATRRSWAMLALESSGWAIAFAAIVWAAAAGRFPAARPVLRWRPLVFIGRISYGVYVVHLFVPYLAQAALGAGRFEAWPLGARLVAGAAASIALAAISWFALERPLNRLRRRIPYVRPA